MVKTRHKIFESEGQKSMIVYENVFPTNKS